MGSLFNIRQGDGKIEDYARHFLGVARWSATEKTCLMIIFWGGLAEPFKSRMPYWVPEESLEDYINLALNLSVSAFRQELAAEPATVWEPTESTPKLASFREPTESTPELASFREPTESAPKLASFREPTESAPEPALFREPTESAPNPALFREPTESAPKLASFREPTESAPKLASFREPTESAPEPALFREPTESAPELASFREPTESAPKLASFREPTESAPELALFREPTESTPEPALFREPTESAPEPALFREPTESAPEPALFREPTESAPKLASFREPTEGRWSRWAKRTGERSLCGDGEARGHWADVSLLNMATQLLFFPHKSMGGRKHEGARGRVALWKESYPRAQRGKTEALAVQAFRPAVCSVSVRFPQVWHTLSVSVISIQGILTRLTMTARHLQQCCAEICSSSKACLDLTGLRQGMNESASCSLQEVQSSCWDRLQLKRKK